MNSKLVIFTMLFAWQLVWAQVSKEVNITSYVDDNVFRSPEPTSDVLSDVGISLGFRPQDSNLQFSYSSDFYLYNKLNERNFSLHTFGLHTFAQFGEQKQHTFYIGSDLDLRLNSSDYNYYDYGQLYFYASVLLNMRTYILKSGYNFRYRGYSNLSELSNTRHYLFVQFNKSLPSRTTFIVEADYGYKGFADEQTQTFQGGRGRRYTSYTYTTTNSTIPSLSHIILLARVAQSLHPKVGAFVQYKKQISLTDQTDYQNSDYYYQDEELFDDPFSYEMDRFTAQLTWLLPGRTSLKLSGNYFDKTYISEQAYVSAADTIASGGIRQDSGHNLFISLEKTFYFNKSWAKALTVTLYYNYLINESNSYWYDYKNSVFSASMNLKF